VNEESGIVDLMDARKAELAEHLVVVRKQISVAARVVGRDPSEVTLIGVTKNFPANDAAMLAELGVHDLGENRAQEGERKVQEATLLTKEKINWHFIGQLQRNKVRVAVSFADVIHSVDRIALVDTLKVEIDRSGKSPLVLLQISLDPEGTRRGGVSGSDLLALADAIAGSGIRLGGVMAVAPIGVEPKRAFAQLAILHEELLRHHPTARWRSAGMSDDFEEAIKAGATHVRLGSSILGSRHLLR
jgi:pyridoxal phosphate enzyme (YggS family)